MSQIRAKHAVSQQPSVETLAAFRKQDGRKDKKGCCGQERDNDACGPYPNENKSCCNKKDFFKPMLQYVSHFPGQMQHLLHIALSK